MRRLVVSLEGEEVFSRDVTSVECEMTRAGDLTLTAKYPSVDGDAEGATAVFLPNIELYGVVTDDLIPETMFKV